MLIIEELMTTKINYVILNISMFNVHYNEEKRDEGYGC